MSTQELPPIDPDEGAPANDASSPGAAPDRDDAPPGLHADDLGMRTAEGWVYRHVTLSADPGQVVEVRGSGGTGRSMLLLTLAGRARPSTGTLHVLGFDHPRDIRPRAAVARVHDVIGPEPEQTVHQAMVERARWDRVHPRGSDGLGYRIDEVRELTGLDAPDHDRVTGLPRVQQTLLAVALALLSRPGVLLLDDLDAGLPAPDQDRVWAALDAAAEHGAIAVASTAGALAPPPGAARMVVDLHPSHVEES